MGNLKMTQAFLIRLDYKAQPFNNLLISVKTDDSNSDKLTKIWRQCGKALVEKKKQKKKRNTPRQYKISEW